MNTITNKNILAIIPARGGSKGLIGKNKKHLGGIPLVARTILSAIKSTLITRIIVSTDDDEIADIAKSFGADVVIRPDYLSEDTSSSEEALLHTINYLQAEENYYSDIIVFLQCTSPFMLTEDINATIELILNQGADSSFSAVPFYHFLWQNPEVPEGINHTGGKRLRRQELSPQFLEAGSIYAMKTDVFLKDKERFCGVTKFYPQKDASLAVEIDDMADFAKAQGIENWITQEKNKNENCFPQKPNAIIFDFDGVFTDNRVGVTEDGKEFALCSRSDGMGIQELKKLNIPLLVLSSESNPIVEHRCKKLALECIYNKENKLDRLQAWMKENDIKQPIMYVGNDINDLNCLKFAHYPVCPADAHENVLQHVRLVLKKPGGLGAVRELCDMLCKLYPAENTLGIFQQSRRITRNVEEEYYVGQTDNRQWGNWQVLALSKDFCLKKLIIKPQKLLSLQYHNHRNEFWFVRQGEVWAKFEDIEKLLKQHESIFIPLKAIHSLSNKSDEDCEVIELQFGERLDENDIVRV